MTISYSNMTAAQHTARNNASAQIASLEQMLADLESERDAAILTAKGTNAEAITEVQAELTAKRVEFDGTKPTATRSKE